MTPNPDPLRPEATDREFRAFIRDSGIQAEAEATRAAYRRATVHRRLGVVLAVGSAVLVLGAVVLWKVLTA